VPASPPDTEAVVAGTTRAQAGSPRPSQVDRRARPGRSVVLCVFLLVLAVGASFSVGAAAVPLEDVWAALGGGGSEDARIVMQELRLPRTVAAVVVGSALAVAGAIMQALVRNPLADPGVLGVNAGAAVAVAIAVSLLGVRSVHAYAGFAFAGALIVTVLVQLAATSGVGPVTGSRLLMGGVAVAAALGGVTSALSVLHADAFDQMRFWSAGSLVGRSSDIVLPVVPFLGAGLLLALLAASSLNAFALGEDSARALGATVSSTRVLAVGAVTLLAGGATAIAGPLAFVGLMVPHLARQMVGVDHRWIVVCSALLGPVLVLLADVVGRVATPGELPVGVVTAFLGAPVLIAVARHRGSRA